MHAPPTFHHSFGSCTERSLVQGEERQSAEVEKQTPGCSLECRQLQRSMGEDADIKRFCCSPTICLENDASAGVRSVFPGGCSRLEPFSVSSSLHSEPHGNLLTTASDFQASFHCSLVILSKLISRINFQLIQINSQPCFDILLSLRAFFSSFFSRLTQL